MRDLGGPQVAARMLFDHQDSNISFHAWLQHLQAQASACVPWGRFALVPAYTLDRFDDRPAPGIHLRHQIVLLEAIAPIDGAGRWVITARAEHDHVTRTLLTSEADRHLEVVNLACHVAPNAKAALEWSHAGDNVAGPSLDAWNAYLQVAY